MLAALLFGALSGTTSARDDEDAEDRRDRHSNVPLIIGHRGASGSRPEHTLASYELAIRQGADYIEPDLVITKDGVLVARHEPFLKETTDVENHPEFANRMHPSTTLDGVAVLNDWWVHDFTLAELKTLRAEERIPQLRPANTQFNGLFQVPTLQEVIDLAKRHSRGGREIGIYPETKHPTYHDSLGLSLEEPLVELLRRNGYSSPNDKVFIQSFEVNNLKDLSRMTRVPIVQLLNSGGAPFDSPGTPYAQMATPAGLAQIKTYADGIGPNKNLIVPRDSQQRLLQPTTLVNDAHKLGLEVHSWTFRSENEFLPFEFRRGTGDPASIEYRRMHGDAKAEDKLFSTLGVDGIFTDFPDTGVEARKEWLAKTDYRFSNYNASLIATQPAS
jgi:glycerophosphoryl diester phosphodiesterase